MEGSDIMSKQPIMPITRYLVRHWTRYLGPEGLCLAVAARQLAFLRGRQRRGVAYERVCFDKPRWARLAGVNPRTIRRRMAAQEEPAWALMAFCRPALGTFHWLVRQDDPLAPHHARGVAAYLREAVAGAPNDDRARHLAWNGLEAVLLLSNELALDRLEAAGEAWDGQGEPDPLRAGRRSYLLGSAVADVVRHIIPWPTEMREALQWADLCRRLAGHLLTPTRWVWVTHHAWRAGLTELGSRRMALWLNLRSRCFFDRRTGELRDTCQVAPRRLARELGCSTRQVRRLAASDDVWDRYVQQREVAHGPRPATWWVRMAEEAPGTAPDMVSAPDGHRVRAGAGGTGHGDRGIE